MFVEAFLYRFLLGLGHANPSCEGVAACLA
jgi:hypothetical protein